MKKIINGKRYNTETAKQLATYDNGYPMGDLNYVSEDLYRTKSGMFFIHAAGGANTIYNTMVEDWFCGGEKIIPLDESGARAWAEQHITAEKYEEIFGVLNDDTAVVSAAIPQSIKDALDEYCKANGETRTDVILRGIKSVIGD